MRQTLHPEMGVRRFGAVNWVGVYTLVDREVRRFMVVWGQTLLAPLVTTGLFLLVFTIAVGNRRGETMGVPFVEFLAPGLLMMAIIQNAFSNVSSSIIQAKVQGNIVDTLMPPLSPTEILVGYLAGGIMRGVFVALSIMVFLFPVIGLGIAHPLWVVSFTVLGGAFLSVLGVVAGLYAQKFDHISVITNFVIVPLSFLSGTFYTLESLPQSMQALSRVSPMFYMIDGMRHAVLGTSDTSPGLAVAIVALATGAIYVLALCMLRKGYRIKF